MRAFRIADRRFPIFDGTGARLAGGRWNSPGGPVIYAAETFAGAVLEVLIHANLGRVPRTHAAVEITIPDTIVTEIVVPETVPGGTPMTRLYAALTAIDGYRNGGPLFCLCRAL